MPDGAAWVQQVLLQHFCHCSLLILGLLVFVVKGAKLRDCTDQRGSEMEGTGKMNLKFPSSTIHLILEHVLQSSRLHQRYLSSFALLTQLVFKCSWKTYIQYKYYPCTSSLCYFLRAGSAVCRAYLESQKTLELPTVHEKHRLKKSFARPARRKCNWWLWKV